jgi:hypothetical protein
MSEQEQEPVKEIERFERRNYKYSNEVTFEFDIDVSDPDTAIIEIADFIGLMAKATEDLRALQKTFTSRIEKPVATDTDKAGGGSNAGKNEEKKPKKH